MTEQDILQLRNLAEAGKVQFKERIVNNGADKRKVFDNAELAEMMSECGNLDPDEAALPNGLTVEDIKNGTSMPRNMFLFTNANYLLPYTGAGSGVRRALEYDPNVIFSNGVDQREIINSANEFVITIPRKSEQVTNQATAETDQAQSKSDPVNDQVLQNTTKLAQKHDQVNDQVTQNTTKLAQKHDQVNDQVTQNTTKLKLSKKQQDIRNYCSVPRTGKEILQRAGVSDHFDSRKRYIYDLVEVGVLERTIPDKPNDPNQKYRRKL